MCVGNLLSSSLPPLHAHPTAARFADLHSPHNQPEFTHCLETDCSHLRAKISVDFRRRVGTDEFCIRGTEQALFILELRDNLIAPQSLRWRFLSLPMFVANFRNPIARLCVAQQLLKHKVLRLRVTWVLQSRHLLPDWTWCWIHRPPTAKCRTCPSPNW